RDGQAGEAQWANQWGSFAGFVSGKNVQITTGPSAGPADISRNPGRSPNCCTMKPTEAVPTAAAMPRIVPSTPCARLNRPVPMVRSVITRMVNTVTTAPVTPSSNCTTSKSSGSDTSANSSDRPASMAKPASTSGLRPDSSDQITDPWRQEGDHHLRHHDQAAHEKGTVDH